MRTLILYYSKTGNTQKYAEDIAEALKCDVLPFKKFKKKMIDDYDTIIFGSRVMGTRIQKLDPFLAMYDLMKEKNIIIFAVGMSVVTKTTREDLIKGNLLDMYHVRFYQLRGSFDYSKLGFVERILMDNSFRLIQKDPDSKPDQEALLALKENPIVVYDQAGVDRIISVVRKIDTVVPEGL
ncbi:MAG: flavodoxin domain-containing protein [Bacilli bacterium]|nr:flavodoxin domain-containing protein [Bacilli bacterium]